MSNLRISGNKGETNFFQNTLRHLHGNVPARIGEAAWQVIFGAFSDIKHRIERANVAADRKRLRIECQRRHRSRI